MKLRPDSSKSTLTPYHESSKGKMPESAATPHGPVALAYVSRGWRVIPCAPKGKTPLTAHGLKDATTDPGVVRRWWDRWPSANIGVATGEQSGFFVFDVDGEEGEETLKALIEKHSAMPQTVEARTGGGGRHLFFRHPGATLRNSAGKLGPGLDIRANGGYIIVPPSIHPNGKPYKWRMGHSPDGLPIADPPPWLLGLLDAGRSAGDGSASVNPKPAYGEAVLAHELADLARASEGTRNNRLNAAAFTLGKYVAAGALPRGLVERALRAQATVIGLPVREVENTLSSGLNAGIEECRAGLAALKEKFGIELKPKANGDGSRAIPPDEVVLVSPDQAAIQSLAQLPPLDYDRVREREAKKLGIRVSTLDAEVAARRPKSKATNGGASGSPALCTDPEPWPAPVDGAELLEEICACLQRFVILPAGAVEAIALWVLHCHAHDAVQISPILPLTSPEVRSGKSSTLHLLSGLVPRPLPAANISAASLFRAVETYRPTLLVDELDTFLEDSEELRGILNSGHLRPLAQVVRTVGEDHEARTFSTWAPKALAKIGRLPATLADRSIEIQMRRKKPDETVEELRLDRLHELEPVRQRAWRWAQDNLEALRRADPAVPDGLNDRQRDNWRPLLAIADLAGGEWPTRSRAAAVLLCKSARTDTDSLGVQLLADLRALFAERGTDRLASAEVVEALGAMEERPWPEYSHGKSISKRGVARLLGRYRIQPRNIRTGQGVYKGYDLADFKEAFERYLPPISPAPSATPLQPAKTQGKMDFSNATRGGL